MAGIAATTVRPPYATPSEPTDGLVTYEELELATRNRGMPLEAMRYDVTPTGLHYLLIHFDIPATEEVSWTLDIGGAVERPVRLRLDDIRAMPSRSSWAATPSSERVTWTTRLGMPITLASRDSPAMS